MKQTSFLPTLIPPISPLTSLCILFFSFLVRKSLAVEDPHFLACNVPKSCGDGQTIRFPFFIQGKQEPYCGVPEFQISCHSSGRLTINISEHNYIVHEIFYQNHTLRVSNVDFSDSDPDCIPLTKNISLPNQRYKLARGQTNLLLLYNCTKSSLLHDLPRVDNRCYGGKKTSLVVASPEENRDLGKASEECTTGVLAHVETYGGTSDGLRGALENGFWLQWKDFDCSICEGSGGVCGFDNVTHLSQCFCTDGIHYGRCNSATNAGRNAGILVVGLLFGGGGIGLMLVLLCCFKKTLFSNNVHYFLKKKTLAHQTIQAFIRNNGPLAIRKYNYSDIKKMTNSFKEKLGEGGYGSVYKGKLQDGCLVAIKVLKELKGNGEEFVNEVASISKTSHINIVALMGFCFEGSKRALIYEFMPNGSLDKFIYKEDPSQLDGQLEWETLYKIALGIARGLEYLHKGCNTRILHFDIKPHNILLDENFCPKISDFGLAKICSKEKSIISMMGARGTTGYIAPEVFCRNFGGVSHKSDVYSYDMMVFEMVGGRKNIDVEVDHTSEIFFPYWIYKRIEQDEDLGMQNLIREEDYENVKKMIIVSFWCIQTDPSNRPPISRVVNMLEGSLESLQVPPKPILSSPTRSSTSSSTTSLYNIAL